MSGEHQRTSKFFEVSPGDTSTFSSLKGVITVGGALFLFVSGYCCEFVVPYYRVLLSCYYCVRGAFCAFSGYPCGKRYGRRVTQKGSGGVWINLGRNDSCI